MCVRLQKALGIKKAAVIENTATGIFSQEFNPALVKITLFGHQAMTDFLVLNDDIRGDRFAGEESELLAFNGNDKLLASSFLPIQGKDVNAEKAVLQELLDPLQLFTVTI